MKKFKELTEGLGRKVPVYDAPDKTGEYALLGHVHSSATSIGAAKFAKKKSARLKKVDGKYGWVTMDESKYGDAMSSRLPSHLEDPRHEPVKPSEAYLKEKKKRELHFANKGDIRVNADKKAKIKADMDAAGSKRDYDDHYMEESVWESYRDQALEEARLHHVLKGHPYHHKSDAELHYIIRDAAEAEKAVGTHDKKAMWKYGDQQNDAATVLGYRKRGGKQIPERWSPPKRVYTEERTPHAGEVYVDPFDKHTIHSYHGAGAKEKRDAYAVYLRSIGSTVKSYSHADDKSYHVMRGHHVVEEMTEREQASHKDRIGSTLTANMGTVQDKVTKKRHHHPEKIVVPRVMKEEHEGIENVATHHGYKFSHRTEGGDSVYKHSSGHRLVGRYDGSGHWAHYGPTKGAGLSSPFFSGGWGGRDLNKHLSLIHKTLKEDAPHAGHVMNFSDRMEHQFFGAEEARKDRDAYAKHLKSQGKKVKLGSLRNQILHGSYGHVYSVTHKRDLNESVGSVPNAAFNEDGNSPDYKPTRPERRRAITYPRNFNMHPTKKELDREKKELEMDGDFRDKLKESWNVGDHVVPKIGPHKGEVHRVIHVHPTGHVNITPVHATDRRNRYHLGAAKAHPNDLEDAPGHGAKKLEEEYSQGMYFHDAIRHARKHGGRVTYGTLSRKWHSISPKDRDYHTSFALDPDEAHRQGEAKSMLGSTSAHRLEEGADTIDNLTAAAKRFKTQVEADAYYKKHPKELNKKRSLGTRLPGLESKRYRNLAENPIVREAFEAAKAKKKNGDDSFAGKDAKATDFKPNDFQEPKDLKSPGQQDPQQAPVQGQPPQFGGKDQKSPEKQSNAPKPEKKTDKLTVKGPGPEDAFQTEPTVAGLTTLVKA